MKSTKFSELLLMMLENGLYKIMADLPLKQVLENMKGKYE